MEATLYKASHIKHPSGIWTVNRNRTTGGCTICGQNSIQSLCIATTRTPHESYRN